MTGRRRLLAIGLLLSAAALLLLRPEPDDQPQPSDFEKRLASLRAELAHQQELSLVRSLRLRQLPDRMPGPVDFLPTLIKSDALSPAFRLGQGRSNATLAIGVPSAPRQEKYLLKTLVNLIGRMSKDERQVTSIVVLLADSDLDRVRKEAAEIEEVFRDEIESGLIEVIAPPDQFYPDFEQLHSSMGDRRERVRWRTKQNLDFAFLMNYCRDRAQYYVQLEDDIISRKGFVTEMLTAALDAEASRPQWFVIEFCGLGFIGKLFKARDLKYLVMFLVMFRQDKPGDWLLQALLQTRFCAPDKKCRLLNKHWIKHRSTLFQHVGLHSSLKGKLQKLQDKRFDNSKQFVAHQNPPATFRHNLEEYKGHSLKRLYEGQDFFWAATQPKPGDYMEIRFNWAQQVNRILIRSGTDVHPDDTLPEETVLMTLVGEELGRVDTFGAIDVRLDPAKELHGLRLEVRENGSHWLALSEILIK